MDRTGIEIRIMYGNRIMTGYRYRYRPGEKLDYSWEIHRACQNI